MTRCESCPYYVADNKGYPFCCLYCKELDFVAIHGLCAFADHSRNDDNNKNKNEQNAE